MRPAKRRKVTLVGRDEGVGRHQTQEDATKESAAIKRRRKAPSYLATGNRVVQCVPDHWALDTEDMLKPSTSIGGIAVLVNQSLHSLDRVGTVPPMSEACRNTSSGETLNRKLLTAPAISPFSTRKTPSLVSPVSSIVIGSTSRRYHCEVTSRPRSSPATRSSTVRPAVPPVSTRLSQDGTKVSPNSAAGPLVCSRFLSTPFSIRSKRPMGAPLSNTDCSSPELDAIRNGAEANPAAAGSLYRFSPRSVNRWPILVPPPGAENADRPSCAARAPALQAR